MDTVVGIDKKKIENFWYYYKIHVIVGIFIAIVLAVTLKDCMNRVTPDLTVSYIGPGYFDEQFQQKLQEKLSSALKDINADGKNVLDFQCMTINENDKSEQSLAMQQKVMIEFAAGETKVFLLDKDHLKIFAEQGAFENLDDIAAQYGINDTQYPEIKLTVHDTNQSHIYGIPLSGNTMLKDLGADTKDMYIAIRAISDKDRNDAKKLKEFDNARSILQEIIKK